MYCRSNTSLKVQGQINHSRRTPSNSPSPLNAVRPDYFWDECSTAYDAYLHPCSFGSPCSPCYPPIRSPSSPQLTLDSAAKSDFSTGERLLTRSGHIDGGKRDFPQSLPHNRYTQSLNAKAHTIAHPIAVGVSELFLHSHLTRIPFIWYLPVMFTCS